MSESQIVWKSLKQKIKWSKQDSKFRQRSHMPKHDYDNDYNYCMLFCEIYKYVSKAVNGRRTDNAVSEKDKRANDLQNTIQKIT